MLFTTLFKPLLLVMIIVFPLFAKNQGERYVIPYSEHVKIYANRIRKIGEQPILIVGTNERLLVLEDEGKFLKVADTHGNTGWVEKRFVKPISVSKLYLFEDEKVMGYLDNPTPVYIIDADDPTKHLLLTRSFSAELAENTEREFIERLCGAEGFGERKILLSKKFNNPFLDF